MEWKELVDVRASILPLLFVILTFLLCFGITGCSPAQRIDNLKVDPQLNCLNIQTSECAGPILIVRNNCTDNVTIGGMQMGQYEDAVLMLAPNGSVVATTETDLYREHSIYKPITNEGFVAVNGTVGNTKITVSYTLKKVARVCDEICLAYCFPIIIVLYALGLLIVKSYDKLKKKEEKPEQVMKPKHA